MPKAPSAAPAHARSSRSEPYALPRMSTSGESNGYGINERPSTAWSASDDQQLKMHRAQGLNWGPISEHFPGKSSNACRKRHERLMERMNNSEWDTIKVEDLAEGYMQCREKMWKILAEYLNEPKWQMLETKCMEKGLKTLHNAARNMRRDSQQRASPGSDEAFDDSGMGAELSGSRTHTPPHQTQPGPVLPLPRESPPSHQSPPRSASVNHPPSYWTSGAGASGASFPSSAATAYHVNAAASGYNSSGFSHSIGTTPSARPPVLAGGQAGGYGYPYAAAAAPGHAYSSAFTGQPSWATGSSSVPAASGAQRLPSLTSDLPFLPPVHLNARPSNHIATSTYG